ncbi:RagB/SusD family nutrient uptake outer membrane protein [Litoribacter populi]|uniref:RagB/SusD family nutrient uptake outer membrane protein n=1 Tax=Litoribacter populi TaxID=2598460 RepID=UPI00117D5DAD|nr:RagB/SusD family nutrient uptake outer membrane protein [Litoribacter populi]
MKIYKNILLTILAAGVLIGCESFLEAIPNKGISSADTLQDLEAILNNVGVFNLTPGIQNLSSDDYYLTDAGWVSLGRNMTQKAYTRELENVFEDEVFPSAWTWPYEQVFYANVCLERLNEIVPANEAQTQKKKQLTGWAKFARAFSIYHLVQTFAEQYRQGEASSLQGLPLPKVPDVNNPAEVVSLEETYNFILSDLLEALRDLPSSVKYKSQPNITSAHALLARVYLSMNEFSLAAKHSTEALGMYDNLLDFNNLESSAMFPIPLINDEVIYHALSLSTGGFERNQEVRIDSVLYQSYVENDLRKQLYFIIRPTGAINFRGSFSGNAEFFSGLTVGELYLIRAECRARLGDAEGAIEDLNRLLSSRFAAGEFEPIFLEDEANTLELVLEERRKELLFRGMRWSDIKRGAASNAKLVREVHGEIFRFESPYYAFPFPVEEFLHR